MLQETIFFFFLKSVELLFDSPCINKLKLTYEIFLSFSLLIHTGNDVISHVKLDNLKLSSTGLSCAQVVFCFRNLSSRKLCYHDQAESIRQTIANIWVFKSLLILQVKGDSLTVYVHCSSGNLCTHFPGMRKNV